MCFYSDANNGPTSRSSLPAFLLFKTKILGWYHFESMASFSVSLWWFSDRGFNVQNPSCFSLTIFCQKQNLNVLSAMLLVYRDNIGDIEQTCKRKHYFILSTILYLVVNKFCFFEILKKISSHILAFRGMMQVQQHF